MSKLSTEIVQLGSEWIKREFLAEEILFRMETVGLLPTLYHSAFTGSIYIKFLGGQEFLGSLRVANHEGKEKYSYKLNLREDIDESTVEQDGRVLRHYWTFRDFDKMIAYLCSQALVTKVDSSYDYLLEQ